MDYNCNSVIQVQFSACFIETLAHLMSQFSSFRKQKHNFTSAYISTVGIIKSITKTYTQHGIIQTIIHDDVFLCSWNKCSI